MTAIEPDLLEQLCAWMDGELPPDQARFLERRLAHDPALRAQWERWQLASDCLRRQPLRLMPPELSESIAAAIRDDRAPRRAARWPWLAAASAAVLVLALLPRLPATDPAGSGPPPVLATTPQGPAIDPVPMADAGLAAMADAGQPSLIEPAGPGLVSPLPSVRDFPLADATTRKPWPRSPLATDERTLQAYLVRHNALAAEDGLGGFMPYVDVVAHEAPAAAGESAADANAPDAGAANAPVAPRPGDAGRDDGTRGRNE